MWTSKCKLLERRSAASLMRTKKTSVKENSMTFTTHNWLLRKPKMRSTTSSSSESRSRRSLIHSGCKRREFRWAFLQFTSWCTLFQCVSVVSRLVMKSTISCLRLRYSQRLFFWLLSLSRSNNKVLTTSLDGIWLISYNCWYLVSYSSLDLKDLTIAYFTLHNWSFSTSFLLSSSCCSLLESLRLMDSLYRWLSIVFKIWFHSWSPTLPSLLCSLSATSFFN